MSDLNRRTVLTLGAALGLVGAVGAAPVSAAPTTAAADPWWVWDDEVDRLVAGLLDDGRVPAVNTAMRSWVNNRDALPAAFPADLTAWLQKVNKLPPWADRGKLRLAASFNRRKDTYLFMLYGLGSGIMSTVIPREARSVYWSAGGADMQDRAAKTFTFGYDLSELTAFEPMGQFVVTANKTRLVHAAVRHLLPRSPHWQPAADEPRKIPISNGDILVTFHSLGTFVHKKLKEWRVPMTAAEEVAFLHSWQVAMSLLGVRDEFIPQTWDAAYAQSAQVLTPILALTPEGRQLSEDLLGLTAQIDLGVTRGFLNEFVRYVLSDEIGDWLELRPDPVARALVRTAWPAFIAFREGLNPIAPVSFYMLDQFIRAIAMLFLNKGASGSTTLITIPTGNRP